MKRSLMQVNVKDSAAALSFYQQAFAGRLVCRHPHDDGTLMHAELDLGGQILALSERDEQNARESDQTLPGNTMQFCLQYGQGGEQQVLHAYEVLRDGAQVMIAPGPCAYSPLMTALTDRYGIHWCLFV